MITYTDLIAPVGPFEESFLEDEMDTPSVSDPAKTKLQVRVEQYIDQAYTKVSAVSADQRDDLARNWTLYLLFHQTYLIKSNTPVSETEIQGLGGHAYSNKQIQSFEDEAQTYLDAFQTGFTGAIEGVTVARSYSGLQTLNRFDF